MTEQLYDKSAYIREFTAVVTTCEAVPEGYQITLDRTAFFPEQGGQYADRGILAPVRAEAPADSSGADIMHRSTGIQVTDVQMKDGRILHLAAKPIAVGTEVHAELDWADRYDKMQQHTGEHIVSGIVHRRFGFNNVGFHLGKEHVTMDYSGEFGDKDVLEIEREANEAVWKNLPVVVTYPSEEELAGISYRSKIEIEGQIRIVEIPGYDVCACCAPHVARTGEIGMIKIVNLQRYKGGVRVYMVCGARALADYQMRHAVLRSTSNLLSVKDEMSCEAAERLKEELTDLKVRLTRTKKELVEKIIEEAAGKENPGAGEDGFILFEDGMDKRDMQKAADRMADMKSGYCGIFSGNDGQGYLFVLCSRDRDCRELADRLRSELGAKGGGSAQMIQGSLAAGKEQILALLHEC